EGDGVGAEVQQGLVQPLLVAETREISAVLLALQVHSHLRRLRVELLENSSHELDEVDGLAIELRELSAQARHLEDLVGKTEQTVGALRDDIGETPLATGQGIGGAPLQELDGAADRRQRGAQLV